MTVEAKPPGRWAYFKRLGLWLGMLWTCQAVMYFGNELAHVMRRKWKRSWPEVRSFLDVMRLGDGGA